MNQETSNAEAGRLLTCSAWLGDFVACLQKRKAKLRAGCRMTVNTETFVINVLPTIEMQLKPRKWLPLKMPDDRWYFDSEAERDEMLKLLMSPNDKAHPTAAKASVGGTENL